MQEGQTRKGNTNYLLCIKHCMHMTHVLCRQMHVYCYRAQAAFAAAPNPSFSWTTSLNGEFGGSEVVCSLYLTYSLKSFNSI